MNKPTFKELYYLCVQKLTNFPYIEEDFDALTNYELLCKVVEELNTMITNMNQQNESIIALYNAFNELKDFVENYFDNLDVQDEINNKLDDMASDGSLTSLIRKYVDPIYQAYENSINAEVESMNQSLNNYQLNVNNQINNISAIVNGLATINPIPVGNISDMTDTTKIYVLITDGYWYYYDGDSWERGGLYQSTSDPEVEDIRDGLYGKTYSSAGNAVRLQINDINNDLKDFALNDTYNERFYCTYDKFAWVANTTNHTLTRGDPSTKRVSSENFIPLYSDKKLHVKANNGYYFQIRITDTNTGEYNSINTYGWILEGDYEETDTHKYAVISFRYGDGTGTINLEEALANCEVYYVSDSKYAEEIEDLDDRVSVLESGNPVIVPSYYESYIENLAKDINKLDDEAGENGDCFIFITDYHRQSNTKHSSSLIEYLLKNTGINFAVFGGDTQNYETTYAAAMAQTLGYKQDFNNVWKDMYQNIGNHEFNSHYHVTDPTHYGTDIMLTWSQIYSLLNKQKELTYLNKSSQGDYYFDNKAQKIRYFVLTCNYESYVTNETTTWFFNELLNVPDNYTIVIISHISLKKSSVSGTTYNKLMFIENMRYIGLACTAYNNRQYYTSPIDSQVYNFTNKTGEVILILSGHTHFDCDNVNFEITDPGLPIQILTVVTTTDAYAKQLDDYGTLSRVAGTTSEQAFDIVRIDKTNRKIYFYRVGAGDDREYDY